MSAEHARGRRSLPTPAETMPDTLGLARMVADGTVRRLAMSALGRRIHASGADEEEILSVVMLRLVEAQQSPTARYDPTRGWSPTTYVYMLAKSAGVAEMRRLRYRREQHHKYVEAESRLADYVQQEEREELAMDRILAALDTDQEREMAVLMATDASSEEVRAKLGLGRGEVSELRTRVRALLLHLRDE